MTQVLKHYKKKSNMIRLTLNAETPLTAQEEAREFKHAQTVRARLEELGHHVELEATFIPDSVDPEINKQLKRDQLTIFFIAGLLIGSMLTIIIFNYL